jgi:hypothetical protein
MASEHLGRRQILTAAGVGVVAAAGMGGTAAAAAPAAPEGARDSITGGWLITRKDAGAPSGVRAVVTFASGGAFMALDIDPPAPPLAGTWEGEENHGFAATFYGSAGDPQGDHGIVQVKVTGRVNGNRISGSYSVRVTLSGMTQTGTGTFRGTRIEAD